VKNGATLRVEVSHRGGEEYDVRVADRTRHTVTAPAASLQRLLLPGETPERGIERVFRFLLRREPPEAILQRFALDDVARYFPSFWSEMAATGGPAQGRS
jgi:hypothetical protein